MTFKVQVKSNNLSFEALPESTLLESGLAAGLNLPHSCKGGSCGSCKCQIIEGQVEFDNYSTSTLTDEELSQNKILMCKSIALSDVTIDIPGWVNGLPIRMLPSKIESIDKIGTVAVLKLKLPANQKFEFYAGQYIDIIYGGKNRSYSLANSPTTSDYLELHIRYRPNGVFSEAVWNELKVGQILRFKGPLGSFKLQDTKAPILMVCTGTGFAPLKAILEQMNAENNLRQVHLIWGNYRIDDLYLSEILDDWQQKLNLKVTLCIDQEEIPGYFHGMVTKYITDNYSDLSQHEVYACGNPAMIESLYNMALTRLNLAKDSFYSDVFTPSV